MERGGGGGDIIKYSRPINCVDQMGGDSRGDGDGGSGDGGDCR